VKAILTYHSLDPSGSPISVAPDEFAAHVRWLASGRVKVVPLESLETAAEDSDAVAITFDDGFENFATHAAEPLEDHGLPATVFVVTRQVGATNAWGGRRAPGIPELSLLDWDALGRLAEKGINLGAHSRTHPNLPALSGPALEDEIEGSAQDLKDHIGTRPRSFAYPYGAVSGAAAMLVHRAFEVAVTTELGMLKPDNESHLLPRLDMYYFREEGRLERWGTPAFRRHLWFRAELRRARRVLSGRS
jgi:peptidoglycan/xylan/chitin deacetylase (PgdA/CDA1 family)